MFIEERAGFFARDVLNMCIHRKSLLSCKQEKHNANG